MSVLTCLQVNATDAEIAQTGDLEESPDTVFRTTSIDLTPKEQAALQQGIEPQKTIERRKRTIYIPGWGGVELTMRSTTVPARLSVMANLAQSMAARTIELDTEDVEPAVTNLKGNAIVVGRSRY
jgi:hypothetical protein